MRFRIGVTDKSYGTSKSFVKTGSVTVIIHFTAQLNFYPCFHTVWEIWMKYGVENLHVTQVQDCEFPVNRLSVSHTLLKAVHKFLPIFYIDLIRFGTYAMQEMTTKLQCVGASFVKIGAVTAAYYLRA